MANADVAAEFNPRQNQLDVLRFFEGRRPPLATRAVVARHQRQQNLLRSIRVRAEHTASSLLSFLLMVLKLLL